MIITSLIPLIRAGNDTRSNVPRTYNFVVKDRNNVKRRGKRTLNKWKRGIRARIISRLGIFRPAWSNIVCARDISTYDSPDDRWFRGRCSSEMCKGRLSRGKDICPLRGLYRSRGKSKLWTVSTIFPSESPSRNMRFILACRSRCHTLCTPCDMLSENPISTRVKLKPSSGENYDDYIIVLLLCEKYIKYNYYFKIFMIMIAVIIHRYRYILLK